MFTQRYDQEDPILLRRLSGGWLAVSPDHVSIRIGVEGDTEEEATRRFREALAAWGRLGDEPSENAIACVQGS